METTSSAARTAPSPPATFLSDQLAEGLSQAVREQRKYLGLSQTEVARRAGISVGVIGRIERLPQHRHMRMRNIIRVLVVLGLRLELVPREKV